MSTTTAAPMRLQLRDYQLDALDRVAAAHERGVYRQLGVAATGLGKTVVFCALAERMRVRTLVLAHRDELVEQAAAKVTEVWPDARVGVVKAKRNELHGTDVVVASVQTLAREKRRAQLPTVRWAEHEQAAALFGEPFGLVVTDEAHHATATSYQAIYDHLGVGKEGGPLHLGVTATPDRGDGTGLDGTYDEVVFSFDILWGIRAGYLSDLRGQVVELAGFNLGDVRTRQGDYDQGQAGRLMEAAGAQHLVVQAHQRYAPGRKTLVFTPTVELARLTHEEFQRAGVPSGYVHAGTPLDERRSMLAAFSSGALQVVSNCGVLTEGYDEPSVSCIVVARPTKSRGLYVQMVGRGTRRHPDKTDCLVLDVTGVSKDHSLLTIPSLFGVEGEQAARDGSRPISEVLADHEQQLVRQGLLRAEDVELFAQVRAEGVAWVEVHERGAERKQYVRPLSGDLPTVVLAQTRPSEDDWNAGLLMRDGSKRALIMHVPLELAQGVAEDYVHKVGGGIRRHLVTTDAPWRERPATRKQLALAKRLGIVVERKATAGEVSEQIDAHKARQRLARAGSAAPPAAAPTGTQGTLLP